MVGQPCKAEVVKQVRVDPKQLLIKMKQLRVYQQQNRDELNRSGIKWMEVHYEDLVENNTKICDALSFLGCGCPDLGVSNVQKIIQKPLASLISNWDEVVKKLSKTEFAHYLYE